MAAKETILRPAFFTFLRDLERHNDRGWFEAHRDRYEREVRDATLRFVEQLGPPVAAISPHLIADARPVGGSITRIYRDVRFSKDKRPYKTQVGIHFFHEGTGDGDRSLPGFYLHLGAREVFVAAGIWHPAAPDLARIRGAIVAGPTRWKRAKAPPVELEGASLKRVPPGFPKDHPLAEDLRRTDFIASRPVPIGEVTRASFPDRFVATCESLDPLNRFLATAVGVSY